MIFLSNLFHFVVITKKFNLIICTI